MGAKARLYYKPGIYRFLSLYTAETGLKNTFGGSMTILEMLGQSGVLTLLGMGVVFGFLIIVVICVSAMGKVVHALGADKDVTAPKAAVTPPSGGSAKNPAVVAAITAAVDEYRKDNS